MQAYLT
jgi:hypothetical protein